MIKIREKFIFGSDGRKKEVVIPYRDYENLREDLHDLAIVAERRNEKAYPWEEIKKKLKIDGLI